MNVALIKRMMDACYQAKRVRDMLPALPDGVLPPSSNIWMRSKRWNSRVCRSRSPT